MSNVYVLKIGYIDKPIAASLDKEVLVSIGKQFGEDKFDIIELPFIEEKISIVTSNTRDWTIRTELNDFTKNTDLGESSNLTVDSKDLDKTMIMSKIQ